MFIVFVYLLLRIFVHHCSLYALFAFFAARPNLSACRALATAFVFIKCCLPSNRPCDQCAEICFHHNCRCWICSCKFTITLLTVNKTQSFFFCHFHPLTPSRPNSTSTGHASHTPPIPTTETHAHYCHIARQD